MSKYLTTIMKILPVVQARQISDLLQEMRAKGELRDSKDYQTALADLAKLVNASSPKPTYEQLRAIVWGLCRSDAHNMMMQAAKNDIEAVFLQTDEIGRRLDDHNFYLLQGLIGTLEYALQDQEDRIRELRLMASKNNEFTSVSVNSFARTTLNRIERSSAGSELLFFDNRTGLAKTEDELPSAYISEHGAKILLPSRNEPRVLPVGAKLLFDSNSYGSKYSAVVNNDLSNVIDGTKDTFWTRTVYLEDPVSFVSTVIEFDLGVGRDINYCIVEGATASPFYVSEILGVGLDGHTTDLLLRRSRSSEDASGSLFLADKNKEVLVDGWERIDFAQVFVKAVRIKFSYGSYNEADYYVSSKATLNNVYEKEVSADMSAGDIAPIMQDILVSKEMSQLCQVATEEDTHVGGSVYSFALDNVWFGNSIYKDNAIFVSLPIHLESPGSVAIKAQEKNVGIYYELNEEEIEEQIEAAASEDLDSDDAKNACSVEYELIKHSVEEGGEIRKTHFPIPCYEQTTVIRERLVLTKRIEDETQNDSGFLRFCPRVRYNYRDISVFKNGVLLTTGSWSWATRQDLNGLFSWHDNADVTNEDWWSFRRWNIFPQKMWIKLKTISPGDVITVSYTIRTSSLTEADISAPYEEPLTPVEGYVYMDEAKTVYLGEDGQLLFIPDFETGFTTACDIYTQITLRRNAPQFPISPEVCEYAFLSAPYRPGLEE